MGTHQTLYNMARFGFFMAGSPSGAAEEIRLEYLIAGVMFEGDSRRIGAGIPVMLCRNYVNVGLLLFLAHRYRFAGRLHGMLMEVSGMVPTRIASALEEYGTKPVAADRDRIWETLRVYAS